MDIRMPEMDGRTALKEIRKDTRHRAAARHRGHRVLDARRRTRSSRHVRGLCAEAVHPADDLHELAAFLPRSQRSTLMPLAREAKRADTPSLFELWPELVHRSAIWKR